MAAAGHGWATGAMGDGPSDRVQGASESGMYRIMLNLFSCPGRPLVQGSLMMQRNYKPKSGLKQGIFG